MAGQTPTRKRYDFARYLNIRAAYAPVFLSDSRTVAFVSDITGVPQLWSVPIEGGWPDQLTFSTERVMGARSFHAADGLIFAMDAGGNERAQIFSLRDGDTSDVVVDSEVLHNMGPISPDDRQIAFTDNRRHPAFFDVYVRDLDGTRETCVYEQDGSNFVADWSPDGSQLLIYRLTGSLDTELFLLDVASGQARHLTPHEGIATYESAQFAPSGDIYLLADEGSEFLRLARLASAQPGIEFLSADDRDVDDMRLSPDGSRAALVYDADGYSRLVIRDLESGRETDAPTLPQGVATELEWSRDGARLTFSFTSPTHNLNVWVWDLEAGTCRQVTRASMAGIDPRTCVAPETVRFHSFDGLEIAAYLYMPPTDRPPVVLNVHGGPESRSRPIFGAVTQYLVDRGYAVLAPNVRGSTGYGRRFTHLDDVDKRMDSVADLKAAVDWLRESGRVDGDHIAVMGGSYGGFMVLAALTAYPDEWAAGVDIVGIANFETFLRNTSAYRRAWRISEYGDPDRDADLLREISPINHVHQITAPLMVIHGDNDPRVPLSEAEQIVEAVGSRGLPVEFLHFPDEGHGVVKLQNRLVAYPAIGAFLDRFLGAS